MSEVANKARGAPTRELRGLVDWVRKEMCPDGKWNRRRLPIFTEWTDTFAT